MTNKATAALSFFFVIGRARSGTTLLRSILEAHPNIKIPLESPLILELEKEFANKTEWSREDLQEFFNQLIQVKDFHLWEMDLAALREKLLQQEGRTTYKQLIETVYLNAPGFFEKEEVLMLGDKNPVYSIKIKQLFKLYPEAKYIHLKRDHRAHVLSMLNAKLFDSDLVTLAYRWRYSAKVVGQLKRKHPASFFTLKYEDFVHDPEKYSQAICNFLGVPFHADMVNYHQGVKDYFSKNKDHIEGHHHRVYQAIDTSRINSWKTDLPEESIRVLDLVVGKWAAKEGYERQYAKASLKLLIRTLPKIWYQHIFYTYWRFYTKLPAFLKNKS